MLKHRFARIIQGASLVLGPTLMGVSTFFWTAEGRQGVTAGTLTALGSVVWLYGLLGLWELVRGRRPVFGVLGGLAAVAGAFGGIAFGMQGFFEEAFGLGKEQSLAALEPHPVAATLLLWLPGPAFPAAVAALGAALLLARIGPR